MKSRSEIWFRALEELGAQCSVSTRRDAETLASRVAREGESFLTVTLPRFGKDFERSLSLRSIPEDLFEGFARGKASVEYYNDGKPQPFYKTSSKGLGIPKFLGGFLDLVFTDVNRYSTRPISGGSWAGNVCLKTGVYYPGVDAPLPYPQLREIPEDVDEKMRYINAIAAVRQLTLMFGKEKEQCSSDRTEAAIAAYEATDQELDDPFPTAGPIPSLRAEGSGGLGRSSLSYSDQLFLLWIERSTEEN